MHAPHHKRLCVHWLLYTIYNVIKSDLHEMKRKKIALTVYRPQVTDIPALLFRGGRVCAHSSPEKSPRRRKRERERESKKPYRFYFNDVVRCGWCWCWNSTVNGGKFAMWKCARALMIFTVTLDFSCLGIAWVACKWKKTGECESDNQEFMALVRLWFNACLFRTQFSNNMWGHDFFPSILHSTNDIEFFCSLAV